MAAIPSSVLADVAVAAATLLVLLSLYFIHAFSYWMRKGVHYVKPTSFMGNVGSVAMQKEHFGQYLKKVYDVTAGHPVVGMFAFKTPFLMVRDLDVLRHVLVTDAYTFLDKPSHHSKTADPLLTRGLFMLGGKRWKNMRIKLTPTFTSAKIKRMFHVINDCSKQLLQCIDQEMSKGKGVAVKDTVGRFSTDIIASCAFGVDANSLKNPNSEFRAITRKIFEREKSKQLVSTLKVSAPWMIKFLKLNAFDNRVYPYIRKIFWDVAEYRKKNGIFRGDFMDVMLQMKEEGHVRAEDANDLKEIKEDSKYLDENGTKNDQFDIKLEDDDFAAQAFTFIAAGYETTSAVVTFMLFELALNPAMQDKLRREIKAVIDKHNSEVTYDAITEMEYLEMVMLESLRKYPSLPVIERVCLADYKIPGTGIKLDMGTRVVIPVLAICKDPAIFPEPEKFDPERFSIANKGKRPNIAHLSFGEGPRKCIGMRFGLMQVKTALVYILTNYYVRPCAETPQPPLGMRPAVGVYITEKVIVLAFEKIE